MALDVLLVPELLAPVLQVVGRPALGGFLEVVHVLVGDHGVVVCEGLRVHADAFAGVQQPLLGQHGAGLEDLLEVRQLAAPGPDLLSVDLLNVCRVVLGAGLEAGPRGAAAVHQYELLRQLRAGDSDVGDDPAALGLSAQVDGPQPPFLDETDDVLGAHAYVAQVGDVSRRVGEAVAQLVDGEHVELLGQRQHRGPPPVEARAQGGAAAVDQQKPVVGRVAGLDEVGAVAVDGLVVLLVLVGAVEQRFHLITSRGMSEAAESAGAHWFETRPYSFSMNHSTSALKSSHWSSHRKWLALSRMCIWALGKSL